jgi:hypothetical protein
MSRRFVLAVTATTVLLGGLGAPALAAEVVHADPTQVCVITKYDPKTNQREGICVWLPIR